MSDEVKSKYEFGKPQRPEEMTSEYREAPPGIKEMIEDLIEENHQHLKRAKFLMLMYEKDMKYRGQRVPGRVYKVHDREKVRLKKDFEIVISEPFWEEVVEQSKEKAALDFLLNFCSIGEAPGDWKTKDPDFYGFYKNVDKFGMWQRSLKNLEKKINQTSLPY